MPQGQDYLWAIQDKDYRFWKVVNGVVTCNAQPYFLDSSPAGWQDLKVQNVRNQKYWAIDRSVVAPLSFVNDGAQILKHIFLNKGHEEPVFLTILEQQLDYNENPAATIAYTSGQSPFTPNATTTGTITGTPGETVYVRMYLTDPNDTWPATDDVTGNFDGFNFVYTGYETTGPVFVPFVIYTLVIPAGGVINFNFYFTLAGSTAVAGMDLVNATNTTPGWTYWYKRRFFGEFDLTTYSHEGSAVKCTILEDGLAKWLKANENTTLELPDTDSNLIYVKLDGINLHEKANYIDTPGVTFSPVTLGGGSVDRGLTTTIFLNKEGDNVGVEFDSQFTQAFPSTFPDTVQSTNCLLWNTYTQAIVITISGTSEFICVSQNGTWAFRRRFLISSSDFPTQDDYPYHNTSTAIDIGDTYTNDYSVTITVPPNERLYAQSIFFGGASGNPGVEFTDNSRFKIEFISRYEPTYVKAFRPQYLFDKQTDFVTDGNYTAATSQFLEDNKNIVFTCGNFIRGIADSFFKWSFFGHFNFWDSFSSVGLSEQNGVIDLAEKQDLIDTSTIIELGIPSEIRVGLMTDTLFNTLKIGYPEIKNEIGVLNGNEEFNCGYEFSLGLMKRPADLDKVCKITASSYAIERLRIQTVNKETTDNKADNDVFPLCITGTLIPASGDIPAHYELDRTLNSSALNLLEPESVFNMQLSPHLNFKRNGPYLHSLLWKCENKTLSYRSSDKNNKLEFDDPLYGHIVEKDSENIGGLGTQFFVPIIFDITLPPPADLVSLLDANPLQVYSFEWIGETYTGILLEISTGMASGKEQEWKLLALPGNNFAKLEKYFG